MIKKILAILTFTYSFLNAQEEMRYDKNAENLPEWIQLMNVDIPDVGLVKDANVSTTLPFLPIIIL